ncbi:plasmid recombination protein [Pseudoalteromonas spongiae]|uniref:Plasmid recombination protein n=1 Tax=Pseudoalteromonas spongiae TaxID=298657 RepID=A0ABU8EU01_9GAMM
MDNKFKIFIHGDSMKNSYQFIHLETYADTPQKNSKRPSLEAVARECQREEESFPHIENPQPPEILYGIPPLEAVSKVRKLVKDVRDGLNRKIRKDAQIASFGVASINVESTPENWESIEVQRWIKDTENFLKKRFGDSFVSLVKHSCEAKCHLHFILIPQVRDGIIDLSSFHPGLAAQRTVTENKKSKKDYAYREAMRTFQDEYYEHVGLVNGQLRYGPRRKRLSRADWYAQKRYAQLLSNAFNDKNKLISNLSSKLEKAKNILAKVFPKQASVLNSSQSKDSELSL